MRVHVTLYSNSIFMFFLFKLFFFFFGFVLKCAFIYTNMNIDEQIGINIMGRLKGNIGEELYILYRAHIGRE